jgi:hypothetical protein
MLWSQNYHGGVHCNIGKEQSSCTGAEYPLRLVRESDCG